MGVCTRLIPAHAGKTSRGRSTARARTAHPRSRGENMQLSSAFSPVSGSSPLTRGKLPTRRISSTETGLIPAHAGKTCRPWTRRSALGAHPRSRGENLVMSVVGPAITGSSPLTRGKRAGRATGSAARGLIPAHAGKTKRLSDPRLRGWAHPRSRGENRSAATARMRAVGSSPLTRGKLSV